MAEAKEYIWGTGRRKSAIARVRLSRGTGVITVNKKPFAKYFTTDDNQNDALEPMRWRSRTSSAPSAPPGAAPTPATSACNS